MTILSSIKNEWIKFFFTKMNVIMIAIILLIGIANVVVPTFINDDISKDYQPESWQKDVATDIEKLKTEASMTNNSSEKKTINDEITRLENHLSQHVIPPRQNNLFSVIFELYAMTPLIGISLIVVASSIVAREFTNGTIKFLLIRPISRNKVLLSKLLTIILISIMYLLLLFGSSFIMGLLLTDINTTSDFVYSTGKENFLLLLIKVIALMLLEANIVAMIAFSLSTIFRNNAIVLGMTIILYMVVTNALYLLSNITEFVIYLWPFHFEMLPYIEATGMSMTSYESNLTLGFSLVIHAIHLIPLIIIAFVSFNKRDVLV